MKNIKVEQLPSGSFRIRKQMNGQKVCVVFDHKPTQREITTALAEKAVDIAPKTAFKNCALGYIENRSNVLSPSTLRTYNGFAKSVIPDWFSAMKISDIEPEHIQQLINEYSADHSPKSTYNLHGFISAVFGMYRPKMMLHTTLPQKQQYEPYVPTKDEIKRILDASKGTKYHIPFQLGALGLRRGEICALTISDICGNVVSINKSKVQDSNHNWIIKLNAKSDAGNREIFIPDKLRDEIVASNCIFDGYPDKLLENLHSYQKRLGIDRFRFHDLRHYYASYAHENGMSDADIMSSGGWKSDHVMKSVYRHSMRDILQNNQARIANDII